MQWNSRWLSHMGIPADPLRAVGVIAHGFGMNYLVWDGNGRTFSSRTLAAHSRMTQDFPCVMHRDGLVLFH